MTERQLSRSLDPLPGESLPGFLMRVSYRLERSPRRIAVLCGLANGDACSQAYIRFLPDDLKQRVASTLRLTADEVTALTLQQFSATYSPLGKMQLNAKRAGFEAMVKWASSGSSRYCPECLKGDGSPIEEKYGGPWKLLWHLPVVFACVRHRRLLEHTCPSCELPLNGTTGGKRNLVKNLGLIGTHPLECRNRLPPSTEGHSTSLHGAPCGARLDQAAERGSRILISGELAEYLALQQKILDRLTPNFVASGRISSQHWTYFPDLLAITQLIKLAWPVGVETFPWLHLASRIESHVRPLLNQLVSQREVKERSNRFDMKAAPVESELCGALLLAADTILGDRDLAALRMRVQPMAREAYRRSPSYAYRILQHGDISTTLSRATVRRIHGYSVRARLRINEINFHFRVEEIPSFLPREWFKGHFDDLFAQLPNSSEGVDRYLRRAAPLRLAELVSGHSWPECAVSVGVSKTSAQRTLKLLGRKLDEFGLWPAFEESVGRVARDVDASTDRVNYAHRRHRMFSWRLPLEDWLAMCAEFPHLRRLREKANSDTGSALVWSFVTQGEHTCSPVVEDLRRNGESTHPLAACLARFVGEGLNGPTLIVRRRLELYAKELAGACDENRDLRVSVAEVVDEDISAHTPLRVWRLPNSSETLCSAITNEVVGSYGDLIPGGMWELFRSVVPPTEGRLCGDRDVLGAILFVAVMGYGWNRLSTGMGASGDTASHRFTEWTESDVWTKLHAHLHKHVHADNDRRWITCALDAIDLRAANHC